MQLVYEQKDLLKILILLAKNNFAKFEITSVWQMVSLQEKNTIARHKLVFALAANKICFSSKYVFRGTDLFSKIFQLHKFCCNMIEYAIAAMFLLRQQNPFFPLYSMTYCMTVGFVIIVNTLIIWEITNVFINISS